MASVFDVAQFILSKQGEITATKLQKLCYYSQAWHLVWEERPLFAERIEAWANGPVCPPLYSAHWRQYLVSKIPTGDASALDGSETESIDAVLGFYGKMSGAHLGELSHREAPWREARGDTPPGARSSAEIPIQKMAEYYEGLLGTSADA